MKKLMIFVLVGIAACGLVACNNSKKVNGTIDVAQEENVEEESSMEHVAEAGQPTSVVIQSYNANKEMIEMQVPYQPKRIAILDFAALDILDSLGLGDRVVGMADTSIDYLQSYTENEEILKLGTIKEADYEAIMECDPEVIFISGRLASVMDELSQIAPVVYLTVDTEIGVVESVRRNATTIASMFGLEDVVETQMDQYAERIAQLTKVASNQTALIGMVTSGSLNLLGNDGRCSLIGREIGFENLATDTTSTHGNESSFETVLTMNPNYIFVMDRDSAIGAQGAALAQEVMDNALIYETEAYQNENIVILENPNVWYTAEGGIKALDVMLTDLESALLR